MPSVVLGNQSGGQLLVSGVTYSGKILPIGGVQLRLDKSSSGNVYVGLSGGVTVQSGGYALSGGGLLDGLQMGPGDSYFIPRLGTGLSGNISIYIGTDPSCSGQARIYYEVY